MSQWTRRALIAVAVAFVAAGILFASRLGTSAGEAIITNGIYDYGDPQYFKCG